MSSKRPKSLGSTMRSAWRGRRNPAQTERSVAHRRSRRDAGSGLSRRRSRVRVPSLPLREVPANWHLMVPVEARSIARWPNRGPLSNEPITCKSQGSTVRIRSHEQTESSSTRLLARCLLRRKERSSARRFHAVASGERPEVPGHPDEPLKCQVLRTRRLTGLDAATLTGGAWHGQPSLSLSTDAALLLRRGVADLRSDDVEAELL
jgi:hypothetical protein